MDVCVTKKLLSETFKKLHRELKDPLILECLSYIKIPQYVPL